ncbi:MAG: hypothetical protein V7K48_12115 [Nostoc sp.]
MQGDKERQEAEWFIPDITWNAVHPCAESFYGNIFCRMWKPEDY